MIDNESKTSSSDSEDEVQQINTSQVMPGSSGIQQIIKIKSVPVYQWNVKFDGKNMSLLSFLDRVKELSALRNVSKAQLVASARDLFIGQAKLWWTANCDIIKTWDDLDSELKKKFLPPDWNEKLLSEVNQRTQGPDETIGMYIATMKTAFKRFTCHIPESAKLKILLKNIAPFYQNQLGLTKVKSIEELLKLSCRLEERKASIEAFTPSPRNRKFLEPDLAYVYSEPYSSRANCDLVSDLTCWNCGKKGHRSNQCMEAKSKHCFKCGERNFTVRTCPRCARPQGNYQGRH
ncbi:uncharacterized protein LOC126737634 [Anthonomus grandis grandis]|uniref:uncharacterized protein LOC126737634 n=1 Tax=Anthonomus grandis grandis TaxID=2921223 RepID=UPI00216644D1|nr:uncharacterized protein LOC126737634 [Anthonomus grandis grandis]